MLATKCLLIPNAFVGEILLVGGGGGGARSRGGGGGAGGVRYVSAITFSTALTYVLNVGVGGASQTAGNSNGYNGEASYMKVPGGSGLDGAVDGVQVYIGYGGGGGCSYDPTSGAAPPADSISDPIDGNTLGSGGGGGGQPGIDPITVASGAGGAGVSYSSSSVIGTHETQGTIGGLKETTQSAGSGGGGAGGSGGSAVLGASGTAPPIAAYGEGGIGVSQDNGDFGDLLEYGQAGEYVDSKYWVSGGGGGAGYDINGQIYNVSDTNSTTIPAGGKGGGGAGGVGDYSNWTDDAAGTAGTANTGGGGGASQWNGNSGAGGSGVIIIKIPTTYTGSTGTVVTSSQGGYQYIRFTADATLTFS